MTIIITRSDAKIEQRWRNNKVIVDCDKGGKYKEAGNATQCATKKYGCPFKIRLTLSKDGSRWKIDVKYELYNHDLPDRFEGNVFVGCLSSDER